MISFPPFRLDLVDERLWRDAREIRLRRKPFAILRYLAEHAQRLVTQEELVGAVWGKVAMSESLLRTHVHELRQGLGEGIIETVIGRGYRFLPKVELIDETAQARHADSPLSPLVGRDDALEVLRGGLRDALERRRRIVFVTGDSGIGKSALAEAFLEQTMQANTAWVARGSCVEQYGSGEAYLPVLDALGRASRGSSGQRVIDVLSRHAPTWLAQMPGFVADDELEALQLRVQGATQGRMLRELAEALDVLSAAQPVVLLLEDLQWADHSTAELLAMIGQRREAARLLIVGTCRQTEVAKTHPLTRVMGELVAHGQATLLPLDGLSEAAVAEYLALRFPANAFPSDLAGRIQRPTGGNPLFIVALLDDLERRQMLRSLDGRWQMCVTVEEVAAHRPDTVRRLIDIQIDRLGATEQRVLEAASAAGAMFTAEVVAFALDLGVDQVDLCCEALANERHFLRTLGTESWPDGTIQYRYGFVHALHQHAALARNPSASIRLWHRRIGERLEAGYRTATDSIAAELAVHFDEGHVFPKATQYYIAAGERAVRRFGNSSALRQFERARELVARLPEGRERDAIELRVLRSLAPILLAIDTSVSQELVAALLRAVELATRLGEDASLATALTALQTCRLRSQAFREVAEHASEAWEVAKRLADPVALAEATLASSLASMGRGDLIEAKESLDELCSTLDTQAASWHVARTGNPSNPTIAARMTRAYVAWLLGYPDDAFARAQSGVSCAQLLGEPYSLVIAFSGLAIVQMWRRDAAGTLESAQSVLRIAAEEGFVVPLGGPKTLVQWARATLDPSSSEALADELGPAPQWGRVFFTVPIVEVCARAGRRTRALQELSEALAAVDDTDERVWEPELYRLRGELMKSVDRNEAERCISKAIEIARRQVSKSFELRAALNLYRLWRRTKRRRESLDAVRRLYESFTEGFETGDLLDAKRILEQE